eukprot:TRINITY_DN10023_c0_g1_i1.p1 TRINITY_DN10023_c0_g1~~TRINITY_DN10023_c0_g1_i1.p1  ORF type:complete len:511 (+),score=57.17 TRINITY_DN10023_c0_g1_i1:120-1652(+)
MYKSYITRILVQEGLQRPPRRRPRRRPVLCTCSTASYSEHSSTSGSSDGIRFSNNSILAENTYSATERPRFYLRGVNDFKKELSFLLDLSKPADIRQHAFDLVEKGKLDEALYLFQDVMPRAGRTPTVIDWTQLMNLVGRHGSAFDSLRVFEAITFAGLDPDVMAFATIISIFCKHRLVDEAVSLVRRMAVEFGMKPTISVLVPILQELERRGEPLKIEQMLRSAKELYNLNPDSMVLSILIKAHARAGNLDQAIAIVSQLSDAALADEALCHEVLRAMFLRKTKIELVQKFWILLRSRRSGATAYEYGMMMRIYEAQQEWQSVIRLLQDMLEQKRTVQNCIPLQFALRGCIALRRYQIALTLWIDFFTFQWHLKPDSTSYALLARLAAEEGDIPALSEVVNTCIPDNLTKPVDMVLLRVLYGCLVILRIDSASDYEQHRTKLWAAQSSNGIVKQCSPAAATQTKTYVLKRLEDFKQGRVAPIANDSVSVTMARDSDPTEADNDNSDIDF